MLAETECTSCSEHMHADVLIVWLSYIYALLLCILVGTAVVPTFLLLTERKKKN